MIADLLKNKEFQELEKEYKFLSRARGEDIDKLTYVVFDVETTGLEPTLHELTEIGALKTMGKEVKDLFSSLIKPKYPITPEITRITGIDDEMVKASPPAEKVLAKFLNFIDDCILVAHNADFDLSFIKHHAKKLLDKELNNQAVCTVKLARYLLPSLVNHKLHTVAAHFGFKIENRHRAVGDSELTYQVFTKFIGLLKEKEITNKAHLDALMSKL